MDIENLVTEIVDAAFQVKKRLVPGFLESIYENNNRIDRKRVGCSIASSN